MVDLLVRDIFFCCSVFMTAHDTHFPWRVPMVKWQWQRADLEAMVRALAIAAEQSGLRNKDLQGLGAETKHQQYLKYLCAVGLLYLAQERGKNKVSRLTEETVYLPLPSAVPIIRQAWQLEEEKNEGRRRELLADCVLVHSLPRAYLAHLYGYSDSALLGSSLPRSWQSRNGEAKLRRTPNSCSYLCLILRICKEATSS